MGCCVQPTARSTGPWKIALAIGIVIGAVIGSGVVYPGVHSYCSLGAPVATVALATPLAIVNTPFGGASSLNLSSAGPKYSFESGAVSLASDPWTPTPTLGNYPGSENGSEPWGLYMIVNWTIYSVANVTGLSVAGPCSQPYVAEANPIPQHPSGWGYSPSTFTLALPNRSTDLGEPTSIPGLDSVLFYNGLDPSLQNVTARDGATTYFPYATWFGVCSPPVHTWVFYAFGTLRVPVAIPFTYDGRSATASGYLTWQGLGNDPAATYAIPAVEGVWSFVSIGAPFSPAPPSSLPPAGLNSFSFESCPA